MGHVCHDMPFMVMSPWSWTIRRYRNDRSGLIYDGVTRYCRTISAKPGKMSPAGINFVLLSTPCGEFRVYQSR